MSIIIKGITIEQFYKDLNKVHDMDVAWDIRQLPPHGRLIDAYAFEGDLVRRIEMYYSWQQPRQANAVDCARMDLYAAPTIVEAEGEE